MTHNRVDSSQTGDGGVQKKKRSEKRKTDARSATTNKQKNYNCKSRWLTKVCSNLVDIKMMLNGKQEETGWNEHVACSAWKYKDCIENGACECKWQKDFTLFVLSNGIHNIQSLQCSKTPLHKRLWSSELLWTLWDNTNKMISYNLLEQVTFFLVSNAHTLTLQWRTHRIEGQAGS